ncbi:hypothetical protein [Ectobacillus panaciterrae]|uniref:hypothetical protein n=1 Tax=Ectobacillus panaciterrae TaxID=363872 RepID=UPI00048DDCB6|nr:hypothetical protein [Ectobacillus panaciterrae]
MKVVPKESVMKQIEELVSTLDLLEMNITLRVNHTIKHKEDDVLDGTEIIHAHVAHMEAKMVRHLEEGNWLKSAISLHALAVM